VRDTCQARNDYAERYTAGEAASWWVGTDGVVTVFLWGEGEFFSSFLSVTFYCCIIRFVAFGSWVFLGGFFWGGPPWGGVLAFVRKRNNWTFLKEGHLFYHLEGNVSRST
jgi:hypothetical protein